MNRSLIYTRAQYFARKSTKDIKKEEVEAEKEVLRQKYQELDLQQQLKEWIGSFEDWIDEFESDLDELKGGRPTPEMFNDVMVQAYGSRHPMSELSQCMLRGETNLLVSVYDDTLKEAVMKAIIIHDSELECTIEGKYISVKMGKTKQENRQEIINEAKKRYMEFKDELQEYRAEALDLLKNLEPIIDMQELKICKSEMEECFKKHQKLGQEALDKKTNSVKSQK